MCGQHITRHIKPSAMRRGEGKYCSRSCRSAAVGRALAEKAKLKRIVKLCKTCGAQLFIKPSHSLVEGSYCSKECMAKGYSKIMVGTANPNFKHGIPYTGQYLREWRKGWREKNKDKISAWNRNTKARRKMAHGKHTARDVFDLIRLQRNRCACCKMKLTRYHVDHIYPLARGGSNGRENIQILCPTCNTRKKAADPIKFMQSNGYLL